MNEAQRLVVARDQFALKRQSDEALRLILPSYEQARDNILQQLKNLPEGAVERELWLRQQLVNIEGQFRAVGNRIYDVLPAEQVKAWEQALDNAKDYLKAGGVEATGQAVTFAGETTGGRTIEQSANLPTVAQRDPAFVSEINPEGYYIRPSITQQQIVAAARREGFATLSPGGATRSLDDVLPGFLRSEVQNVERQLRTGFLLGTPTDQIVRDLAGSNQGRAQVEAVVRTSMAEASQAAHNAFFDANEDLLPKTKSGYRWEWDASNDTRLCEICAPLDGARYKERGEAPSIPAHFNCRCRLLPITATAEMLREEGDEPDSSFLERKEVTYVRDSKGKPITYTRNGKVYKRYEGTAPDGWSGPGAYKRPQEIDGKLYWVRRRDLPKGQTLAGDMLKRMNDENKLGILGTKKRVAEWNTKIKLDKYKDNPQQLVRDMLRPNGGAGAPPMKLGKGPKPPGPKKPSSTGPKPKPATPTYTEAEKARIREETSARLRARAAARAAAAAPPPKPAPVSKPAASQVLEPGPKNKLVFAKQGGTAKIYEDSRKLLEQVDGEVGANARKMQRFIEKENIQLHPAIPEKFSNGERFKGNEALLRSQRRAVEVLEKQGNDPGALSGAKSLLKSLEDGNFGELKHVMGKASGAAGYTSRSSGIVNVAMTPNSTTFDKKRIQRLISSAEDSLKQQNAYINYYKDYKAGTVAPKPAWNASGLGSSALDSDQWLSTTIHEVGHQVHFRGGAGTKLANKYRGLKGETFVSQYSHTNEREQFAEAFVHYVLNPKGLKQSHPRLYQWVDDILEEALK